MKTDGFLVAKDRNLSLYQDDNDEYYFVEKTTPEEADKWLNETFITVSIETDASVMENLRKVAEMNNMSLDSYITTLLEEVIYKQA